MKLDRCYQRLNVDQCFRFLEMSGICGYSLGFLGEGASNDSGVVEERNFQRLLLAIIMFGNFTQDI